MIQDVNRLKEIFTERALPALRGLKPEHNDLCMVSFEIVNDELIAIVTFHRWTSHSLDGPEKLLMPQQRWFYEGVMSFLWSDENHSTYNVREGNLDWLNRIVNDHYEHKTIYYSETHFAKLKITLGKVQ